jgi:hypothetical protein
MKTPRACPPTPDGQTRGVPAFSARLATPQSKPRYFRRQRASTDPPTKPSYATVPTQLQPLPTTSQSRGQGGPRHCNAVTDTFRDLVARAALPAAPPLPPPESKEARRAQLCVSHFLTGCRACPERRRRRSPLPPAAQAITPRHFLARSPAFRVLLNPVPPFQLGKGGQGDRTPR